MPNETAVAALTDDDLVRSLHDLLRRSRGVEADLVAHIGEVDARRLYAREAAPSMFVYCTSRLGLSEAEAYLRIEAGRLARRFPRILDLLRDGRLHLSGIARLAPHLTEENVDTLLARAEGRTKREILELIAGIAPLPDVPATVRKLPTPALVVTAPAAAPQLRPDGVAGAVPPSAPSSRPAPPPIVAPLSPARYRVEFTASNSLREKLEELRGLMRAADPDVDLAAVIEAAVTEKLERLRARRFALTLRPRKALAAAATKPVSRSVPAAVRREVYQRDDGQCAFVDAGGRRCPARSGIEFHHRHPWGYGGSHGVDNVTLLCTAHNAMMAEVDYGRARMAAARCRDVGESR